MIKQDEDSSTGMPKDEINRRRSEQVQQLHDNGTPAKRRNILRQMLIDGNPWEESNGTLIAKVNKKFAKTQLGSKAAKAAEHLSECGEYLDDK